MICIIAMVVFGLLSIFSAAYRKIAKEAFDCVFRRITFRKCDTGLDQRLKSSIISKLIRRNKPAARFVFKNFEVLSWVFTILLVGSLAYTAYGIVNLAIYGNCTGNTGGFCVFVPGNVDVTGHVSTCGEGEVFTTEFVTPQVGTDPTIGPEDAQVTIIEFGCFSCHYSKMAEPLIKQVLEEYPDVRFVFKSFPILEHEYAYEAALADQCARDQNKFWEFKNKLFEQESLNDGVVQQIAKDLEMDMEAFNDCIETDKYNLLIQKDIEEGKQAGVFGTPTFFINDQILVGPESFEQFKRIIDEEMK